MKANQYEYNNDTNKSVPILHYTDKILHVFLEQFLVSNIQFALYIQDSHSQANSFRGVEIFFFFYFL